MEISERASGGRERSIARQRAIFAYERASKWKRTSWGDRAFKEVAVLPITIRTQGLSTTIARMLHKGKVEHQEIVRTIAEWLLEECPVSPLGYPQSSASDFAVELLEAALRADRRSYMAAQAEALAILEQLKIMAQAISNMEQRFGEGKG